VYKNAATSMIVILGHLKIDMEVSDIGMETAESNSCRRMSEDDGDTSSILAIM